MITRILRFSPINATTNVIIGVTLQLVDSSVNVSAEGLINSVVSEVACVAVLLAPVTLQLIQISLL